VDFQSSFIISADFESWKFITHPHRIVVKGSRDKLCSVWAQSLNCWSSNVAAVVVFQVSIKVTPSSVKAHNWLVSFSELTSSNMAGYATVCARFLKEKSFSNFTDFEKAWQNVDVFYISHDLNKQQTDPIGLLFSSSNVLCQKCFYVVWVWASVNKWHKEHFDNLWNLITGGNLISCFITQMFQTDAKHFKGQLKLNIWTPNVQFFN
jgi:hypothetical protein